MNAHTALDRAVAIAGSQEKLAASLGIVPMAISQWRKRRIPAERCRDIERVTDGAVTACELRPDLFCPAPREAA